MSGSTSLLDLLAQSQSSKETVANTLFNAGSPATLFGKRDSTTTGLTWGYFGGAFAFNGETQVTGNGTVSLSDSATNYIEAAIEGSPLGVSVTANTTGFTQGRIPLYTVVCSSGAIQTWVDRRALVLAGDESAQKMRWRLVTDSGNIATTDADNAIAVAKATAVIITVQSDNTVPIASGSAILIYQEAAGSVTIEPGVGVTIRNRQAGSPPLNQLAGQYALATLVKRGANEWIISGDLA